MGRTYYNCPCCRERVWVHSFWGAAWVGAICYDCRNKHGNRDVDCYGQETRRQNRIREDRERQRLRDEQDRLRRERERREEERNRKLKELTQKIEPQKIDQDKINVIFDTKIESIFKTSDTSGVDINSKESWKLFRGIKVNKVLDKVSNAAKNLSNLESAVTGALSEVENIFDDTGNDDIVKFYKNSLKKYKDYANSFVAARKSLQSLPNTLLKGLQNSTEEMNDNLEDDGEDDGITTSNLDIKDAKGEVDKMVNMLDEAEKLLNDNWVDNVKNMEYDYNQFLKLVKGGINHFKDEKEKYDQEVLECVKNLHETWKNMPDTIQLDPRIKVEPIHTTNRKAHIIGSFLGNMASGVAKTVAGPIISIGSGISGVKKMCDEKKTSLNTFVSGSMDFVDKAYKALTPGYYEKFEGTKNEKEELERDMKKYKEIFLNFCGEIQKAAKRNETLNKAIKLCQEEQKEQEDKLLSKVKDIKQESEDFVKEIQKAKNDLKKFSEQLATGKLKKKELAKVQEKIKNIQQMIKKFGDNTNKY